MIGIIFFADAGPERSKSASKEHVAFTRANIRGLSVCNCLALLTGPEHMNYDGSQEALVATFAHEDSDVSLGSVSREYLRKHCTRIDETLARRLHPALFARLDAD